MDTDRLIKRVVRLDAGVKDVWNALVNPEKTKEYMFNCCVKSDWKVGSVIRWTGNYQGYESGEKGTILVILENKELKYSSIDPNFGIEDIPVNYLHITYLLRPIEHRTELTIVVENFNDNKERLIHVAQGWDSIVIPSLKKLFDSENSNEK